MSVYKQRDGCGRVINIQMRTERVRKSEKDYQPDRLLRTNGPTNERVLFVCAQVRNESVRLSYFVVRWIFEIGHVELTDCVIFIRKLVDVCVFDGLTGGCISNIKLFCHAIFAQLNSFRIVSACKHYIILIIYM